MGPLYCGISEVILKLSGNDLVLMLFIDIIYKPVAYIVELRLRQDISPISPGNINASPTCNEIWGRNIRGGGGGGPVRAICPGAKQQGAKRSGGETSRGGNGLGRNVPEPGKTRTNRHGANSYLHCLGSN